MPSPNDIREEVSRLADEEFIARLRSGYLTEIASEIVCRELAGRGVDLSQVLAQPVKVTVVHGRIRAFRSPKLTAIPRRVLRFPLRAALGVEPLWVVVLFGAASVVVLFRLLAYGLVQLIDLRPMPGYVLPLAYTATAVMAFALAWYGVALWRSASRVKSMLWKGLVRILAVLVAIYAVLGTVDRVQVMQKYFSPPQSSIMDSTSK